MVAKTAKKQSKIEFIEADYVVKAVAGTEASKNPVVESIPEEFRHLYTADEADFAEYEGSYDKCRRIQFNGQTGRFVDKEQDQERDSLHGVVLAVLKSKRMFGKDERGLGFGKGELLCRQPSSLRGDSTPILNNRYRNELISLGCGNCATCPMKDWSGDERPPCDSQLEIVLIDSELGEPVAISFAGTSLKPVRDLLSSFKRTNLPLFSRPVHITREKKTRDKEGGAYYCVSFTTEGYLHPELMPQTKTLRTEWLDRFIRQDKQELPALAAAPEATDDDDIPEASLEGFDM